MNNQQIIEDQNKRNAFAQTEALQAIDKQRAANRQYPPERPLRGLLTDSELGAIAAERDQLLVENKRLQADRSSYLKLGSEKALECVALDVTNEQLQAKVESLEKTIRQTAQFNAQYAKEMIAIQDELKAEVKRLRKPIENLIDAAERAANATVNRSGLSDDSEPVLDSRFTNGIRLAVKEVRSAMNAVRKEGVI